MANRIHTEQSWANDATWSPSAAKESGFHTKTVEPKSRAEELCEQERWDELCEHYLELAESTPAPDLARALCQEALGLAELAHDPRRIIRAAHARILAVDPADAEAFEILAGVYRQDGDGDALVEMLLARLEICAEATAKAALLERIAVAFEGLLDDPAQAFDARVAAFDLGAPTPITTSRLASSAAELGRWDELAAKAAARLQSSPGDVSGLRLRAAFFRTRRQDAEEAHALAAAFQVALAPGDRVAILVELGELCERTDEDRNKAVTLYQRALEIDARWMPALKGLTRVLTELGAHRELCDVLEKRLSSATDPDAQAAVRCELAAVHEKHLGDPERAAALYRASLDSERGRAAAWAGLERIYSATKRFADLAELLGHAAKRASTPIAAADTLVRLGEIYRVHFLRTDLARACFEEALAHAPRHIEALDALAACFWTERRRREWAETLERKLPLLRDRAAKQALAIRLVEACLVELGDPDRAMSLLLCWIGGAENAPGLWGRVVEKASSPAGALDFLLQLLEVTLEPTHRRDLHADVGARALGLDETELAVVHFEAALEIDPRYRPAIAGLRAAMAERGNDIHALALLEREQDTVQSPRERSSLICEIAEVYQSLGQEERARAQLARALELDPRQDRAAWPLFAHAIARQEWEQALRFAYLIPPRLRARPVADQVWFRRHHAKALRATGDLKAARRALLAGHQADGKDIDTLAELGEVTFSLGDWKNALAEHGLLLSLLGDENRPLRARTHLRVGLIQRRLGSLREASRSFDKAAGLGAVRGQALEQLTEVYDELGDHRRASEAVEQRLELESDDGRRVELLLELGKRLSAAPASRDRAAACYERALAIDPSSRRALVELLAFYRDRGQWTGVMQTLQRLYDIEPENAGRSRQRYAMAQVCRDALGDDELALEHFEAALDLDSGRLAAFERINEILTKARDWARLERSYRRMIRRIDRGGSVELTHRLWHSLGLIYRDRLGDHPKAIEAFGAARALVPGDRQDREILAELYDLTGRHDEALLERHALLELEPRDRAVLGALFASYRARGDVDAAWCMAHALSGGAAAAGEPAAGEPATVGEALDVAVGSETLSFSSNGSALSDRQWRSLVCHRELCPYLDGIFRHIAPAVIRSRAAELASRGELPALREGQRDDGRTRLGRAFSVASALLATPRPALFVRPDLPGTLSMAPIPELGPIVVAGRTAIDGLTDRALGFVVGRHLCGYRPEWILRSLFSTRSELTVLFQAAMSLVVPAWEAPTELAQASRATAVMLARAMTSSELDHLGQAVARLRAAGKTADVGAWAARVDMTVARAGLLVSGDVLAAERILRAEPQRPGDDLDARIRDLYAFGTSRSYLSLRRTLGVLRARADGGVAAR